MRELIFDLSADSYLPKTGFAGFEGEHCATELSLILPERLQESGAEYYMVFEILKTKETVFSAPIIPQEGKISLEIPKQLMVSPGVSVYGASYKREGGDLVQIAKTGRVSLEIKDPENGTLREYSSSGGVVPGLVIENEILSGSRNPVSSDALDKKFTQMMKAEIVSARVNENGELVLEKHDGSTVNAGRVGILGEEYALLAEAVKGVKKGEVIHLDDVSSLEHEIKIKVITDLKKYETDYDSGPIFYVDNLANMFDWITGEKEGYYKVKSVSGYVVTFEDGSYMEDQSILLDEIFTVGQAVYFGGNDVYAAEEFSFSIQDIKVTVIGKNSSEATVYTPDNDLMVYAKSHYPEMTISCNIEGVILEAEYNRDTNKVIESLVTEERFESEFQSVEEIESKTEKLEGEIQELDNRIETESKKAVSDAFKYLANAIKDKVSGEYIRLDDVSPFEHEISVKVSGETKYETQVTPVYESGAIFYVDNLVNMDEWNNSNKEGYYKVKSVSGRVVTFEDGSYMEDQSILLEEIFTVGQTVFYQSDLSVYGTIEETIEIPFKPEEVTVIKYANNFVDIKNPSYQLNSIYEVDREGVVTLTRGNLATGAQQTYVSRVYWDLGKYDDFAEKTYIVSFDVLEKSVDEPDILYVIADFRTSKEKIIKAISFKHTGKQTLSFTVPKNTGGFDTLGIRLYCQSLGNTSETGEYIKFKNLQVQIGDTVIEPTLYTPNADGDVEGIIGNGDIVTLMTDTIGATIEAEYNADTKKYIDKKFLELASMIVSG